MSASGSASSSRMSAYLPVSIVPKSFDPCDARAPFFVAETIACAGVIPSSTSPSIADTVAVPGIMWRSTRGVRLNSGAPLKYVSVVGAPQRRPLGFPLAPQLPTCLLALHQLERVVLERVCLRRVRPRLSLLIILPRFPGDAVREDRADHLSVDDQLHEIGGNGDVVHLGVLDEVDASEDRDAQWLGIGRMRLGEETALLNFLDQRLLLAWREGDQVIGVSRADVLHEVDALGEILINR